MDVVVIGGGPAGMLAAISASNQGDNIKKNKNFFTKKFIYRRKYNFGRPIWEQRNN